MKIDLTSLQFNSSLQNGVGTPSWGTSFGQSKPHYFLKNYDRGNLLLGLVNNFNNNIRTNFRGDNNIILKSLFKNVFIHFNNNSLKLKNSLILVAIEELSQSHNGRKSLKYNTDLCVNINNTEFENQIVYNEITESLKNNINDNPCWFVYKIEYFESNNSINLFIIKVDNQHKIYVDSKIRKQEWEQLVEVHDKSYFDDYSNEVVQTQDYIKSLNNYCFNKIYFGPPGTGKSHAIKEYLKEKNVNSQNYSRVTFHPDYDYHSFVGGYKPFTDNEDNDKIKYKFVPQVFTDLYVKAWSNKSENYYLVIEEINRGNCTEIFGDIFQLLDRNTEYNIEPSSELKAYLKEVQVKINEKLDEENHINLLFDGKLQMPNNLSILASMNTSDQSLFPMDSAFKRRWVWEYVPICYEVQNEEGKSNESFNFEIDLGDGSKYKWIDFIAKINNNHIKNNQALGMDKCIGNYFIKPNEGNNITLKPFINKVIFYLWNDVFKDEDNKVFESNGSYEDFFPILTNGLTKVKELFERIELAPIAAYPSREEEQDLGQVAEDNQPYGE